MCGWIVCTCIYESTYNYVSELSGGVKKKRVKTLNYVNTEYKIMNRYLDHNAKNCYNNKTAEFMDI